MYVSTGGIGQLGQGPIALQPFPPPPDLEELTEEEQRQLDQAVQIGLVVVIVAGAAVLVLDEILKRRR